MHSISTRQLLTTAGLAVGLTFALAASSHAQGASAEVQVNPPAAVQVQPVPQQPNTVIVQPPPQPQIEVKPDAEVNEDVKKDVSSSGEQHLRIHKHGSDDLDVH